MCKTNLKSPYFLLFTGISVFIFVLNFLFPIISDDYGHLVRHIQLGGLKAVQMSFEHWNARSGELILLLFGPYLSGTVFNILNSLMFIAMLWLIHLFVFRNQETSYKETSFLFIFFTLISFSTVFGAVFLWRAGAFNYLWAIVFCLLHFLVYRYYYTNKMNWYDNTHWTVVLLFCLFSYIGGMSSFDIGATGSIVHIILFLYHRKHKCHIRYILPATGFILGFITIYLAPGTAARAHGNSHYIALGEIISWLIHLDINRFALHYLDTVGKSMYKTNYMVAIASIFICVYTLIQQKKYHIIPLKNLQLLMGYLGVIILLVGLLFMGKSKPSGDALGATILLANFLLSLVFLYFLLKTPIKDTHNHNIALLGCILYILLILNVSVFTVGVIPPRRAYLAASLLSSIITALVVSQSWKNGIKKVIFVPLLTISVALLSLETWGLYYANKVLVLQPMQQTQSRQDFILKKPIQRLKASQFYGWSSLATKAELNRGFAKYYNLNSVVQPQTTKDLSIKHYIQYLQNLQSN